MGITEELLHEYRCIAAAWLEWSVPGGAVDKQHPRYVAVTEGRDRTPQDQRVYSSCADLYHWLAFRLGIREDWVNRTEHHGWRRGVAVNLLYPPPVGRNPYARRWGIGETKLEAGDCLVIGTTGDSRLHVVPVIDELGSTLLMAEYGANGMRVGGIGGRLEAHPWTRYVLGDRVVRVVIRLADVLAGADAKGLLVAPERPPQDDEPPTPVECPRPQHA